jgi:hypothetical protein
MNINDARSQSNALRHRDIAESLLRGCQQPVTEGQRILAQSAATLTLHGQVLQEAFLRGEAVDTALLNRTVNATSKLLSQLGVGARRPHMAVAAE